MNLLVHECSRIYHCNSLLACITSEQIARMQKITKQCYLTGLPQKTSWTCHTCPEETPLASCCRTHLFKLATFSVCTLMTLCQGPCLSCCLSSHSPSKSLFFLSNTSDCFTCQPEDCWCTTLSVPGSSSLEITAHGISTSPHPCHFSELDLKPTSPSPPFHDIYPTVCTL